MPETAKEQFIELLAELQRDKGLDELTSRVIGILFIEPREVALEELSERTGYCLSAVCTSMKMLVRTGIIRRVKKPGSRKVYFFLEKDILAIFRQSMKTMEGSMSLLKTRLPQIIEKYRTEKSESSRNELRVVEEYYTDVVAMEGLFKKIQEMFDDIYKKREKKK